MKLLPCHHCKLRARFDTRPASFLGRLWRWHINFCPGWKLYLRQLDPETRAAVLRQYRSP